MVKKNPEVKTDLEALKEIVEEEKENKSLQDFPFFNLMRIRKEILGEDIYEIS